MIENEKRMVRPLFITFPLYDEGRAAFLTRVIPEIIYSF